MIRVRSLAWNPTRIHQRIYIDSLHPRPGKHRGKPQGQPMNLTRRSYQPQIASIDR